MAVLSPALVVSMCVMFVLTRLHRHYYIFEHPLLFGLKYCLEPVREELDEIVKANSTGKAAPASSQTKKKGKQVKATATSASKPKPSVSSLSVRRTILNETFFSSEAEFPHHREFDHLMVICCGYLAAYIFEDVIGCFFPSLFANSRSTYVAVFGVGFAIFEASRISLGMTSLRIMLALAAMAWLVALFFTAAGDFTNFVHFDAAYSSLNESILSTLVGRFNMEDDAAKVAAGRFVFFSRILTATIAALMSAAVAAPARRFSRIDYDLHRQYRQDEQSLREDPYALEQPSALSMLTIGLDYAIPALTLFAWCITPRESDAYPAWRLSSLLACVAIRFMSLRIRLQSYLDGAIDAFRKFWTDKASSNALQAGQRTTLQVIGTSFYLMMITMTHVAPALMPLLLTLVAKRDGGVRMGLCPIPSPAIQSPGEVFTREIAAFLAWWCIGSYLVFAAVSILVEFVIDFLEPGARDRGMKLPPPSSSSERRRQRRMMRTGNA